VASHAAPGDVVLVMSNGAFDGVHEKILRALTMDLPGQDLSEAVQGSMFKVQSPPPPLPKDSANS
jgi:hypothetical protein